MESVTSLKKMTCEILNRWKVTTFTFYKIDCDNWTYESSCRIKINSFIQNLKENILFEIVCAEKSDIYNEFSNLSRNDLYFQTK